MVHAGLTALALAAGSGRAIAGGETGTEIGQSEFGLYELGAIELEAWQPGTTEGQGFGGVRLPLEAVGGRLEFAGVRAWVWSYPPGGGRDGTRRVVLERDVRAVIGGYEFVADRAAVWVQRAPGEPVGTYQVFAVFDGLDLPGRVSGFAASAERLPVQGVVRVTGGAGEDGGRGGVRLRTDLTEAGPPGDGDGVAERASVFLGEAEALFAEHLRTITAGEVSVRAPSAREAALADADALRRLMGGAGDRGGEPEQAARKNEEPALAPGARDAGTRDGSETVRDSLRGAPAGEDPEGRGEPAVTGRENEPGGTPGGAPGGARSDPAVSDGVADSAPARGDVGGGAEDRAPVAAGSIFRPGGVFSISTPDQITVRRGEGANAVTLTGGVVVQYTDASSGDRLEMQAARAVVFLREGALTETLAGMRAEDVLGLYLEGGFSASNGQYTVRGPRAYYDVARDRAIMPESVFWTYDQKLGMPLYIRAEALRQEASDQFSAKRTVMSNTGFVRPNFSIGADSMRVTILDDEEAEQRGGGRSRVDARNITVNAGRVPFFWWPAYVGDPERFPLRGIGFVNDATSGAGVLTTWDTFALLGIEPPAGLSSRVRLDYYAERFVGLGASLAWNKPERRGMLSGYMLPDDGATERAVNGVTLERESRLRGAVLFEDIWRFRENWTLISEGAYFSDEGYVQAFLREDARTRREFTNRVHLRRVEGSLAASVEVKGAANDFISNHDILQAPGYLVDKLPEIELRMLGADLGGDAAPGILTHTWEASYTRARLRFSEVPASELGFITDPRAQRAFGTDADASLGDLQRSLGLDESYTTRVDTRQELASPLRLGAINLRPFVVGRVTAYDTGFEAFSPAEDDRVRLWGAAGVTVSTSIARVFNDVESAFFDVHRLRHIIEPSMTLWVGGASIDSQNLPVYDDDVEPLLEGVVFRGGISQTLQTQRGGPGRWRSVDLLTLDVEYVYTSQETDRVGAIPRFYDARPELSTPGDHVRVASAWQATDVVTVAGETIYDLEISQQARSAIGVLFQHTPEFQTGLDLRFINSQNVTYGGANARYTLTDKYEIFTNLNYNFQRDEFQSVTAQFDRRFPNLTLGVIITFNAITNETSFGVSIQPLGLSRGGGLRGLGNSSGGVFQ